MDAHSTPLFLSPALPSDLLQFIINRCTYPTTLLICSDRSEFLSSLTQDLVHRQQTQSARTAFKPHDAASQQATADPSHPGDTIQQQRQQQQEQQKQQPPASTDQPAKTSHTHAALTPHPLLTPILTQLSTTRHIRTLFIPTVSHLRASLSVFSSPSSSSSRTPVPQPPPPPRPSAAAEAAAEAAAVAAPTTAPAVAYLAAATATETANTTDDATDGPLPRGERRRQKAPPPPLLLVYNLLALHRNTSEWSVQGLGQSAAAVVEAGRREGLRVLVVDGVVPVPVPVASSVPGDAASGEGAGGLTELLAERVPVLSGGARRAGEVEWAGKTVDVGRVLGRWFRFCDGGWDGMRRTERGCGV